jgi:hypothetical protein
VRLSYTQAVLTHMKNPGTHFSYRLNRQQCLTEKYSIAMTDRLCDLMATVPGYIIRGPGLIPGSIRFPEKY